jgi:hypothetical protein
LDSLSSLVKNPERFVILSSDKSSECNLSCFFDRDFSSWSCFFLFIFLSAPLLFPISIWTFIFPFFFGLLFPFSLRTFISFFLRTFISLFSLDFYFFFS